MNDFPKGIFAKKKHDKAPAFVVCKISIKRAEAIEWLQSLADEYINLDVKESRDGKLYTSIDTWKPQQQPPVPIDVPDDLPY
jgi:hypothetical protein